MGHVAKLSPPNWIKAFLAADLVLAVMHVIDPAAPAWAERGGDTHYFFNLSAEGNIPTWYSSMQLALIGFLLLGFAASRPTGSRWASLVLGITGAAFFGLSLDEIAAIHEKLGQGLDTIVGEREGTALEKTGPWALIIGPLFVAALALAAYLARDLLRGRRQVALLFLAGASLYVVSFAGLELFRNSLETESVVVVFEETGEMVGATLLLWATYALMRSHGIRLLARDGAGKPAMSQRSGS